MATLTDDQILRLFDKSKHSDADITELFGSGKPKICVKLLLEPPGEDKDLIITWNKPIIEEGQIIEEGKEIPFTGKETTKTIQKSDFEKKHHFLDSNGYSGVPNDKYEYDETKKIPSEIPYKNEIYSLDSEFKKLDDLKDDELVKATFPPFFFDKTDKDLKVKLVLFVTEELTYNVSNRRIKQLFNKPKGLRKISYQCNGKETKYIIVRYENGKYYLTDKDKDKTDKNTHGHCKKNNRKTPLIYKSNGNKIDKNDILFDENNVEIGMHEQSELNSNDFSNFYEGENFGNSTIGFYNLRDLELSKKISKGKTFQDRLIILTSLINDKYKLNTTNLSNNNTNIPDDLSNTDIPDDISNTEFEEQIRKGEINSDDAIIFIKQVLGNRVEATAYYYNIKNKENVNQTTGTAKDIIKESKQKKKGGSRKKKTRKRKSTKKTKKKRSKRRKSSSRKRRKVSHKKK